MNSLVIVALSLMVAMTTASQCGTLCTSSCGVAKTNCEGAAILGALCGVAHSQCVTGCGVVCACDDACEAQCTPDLTSCKEGAANNPIAMLQCSANFNACLAQCEVGCSIQNVVDTVGMIMGGGAAQQTTDP